MGWEILIWTIVLLECSGQLQIKLDGKKVYVKDSIDIALAINQTQAIHVRVLQKQNLNTTETECFSHCMSMSALTTMSHTNFSQSESTLTEHTKVPQSQGAMNCSAVKSFGECDIVQHATLVGLTVATVSGWLLSMAMIVHFICCKKKGRITSMNAKTGFHLDRKESKTPDYASSGSSYISVVGLPQMNYPVYDQLREEVIAEI